MGWWRVKRVAVRISGQISEDWSDWFEGLTMEYPVEGETLVSGYLPDSSAVHGLLDRMWSLGMDLLSVRVETEIKPKGV